MRLQWLVPCLIALALGAFVPRTARAQPEVTSTAVLGLEAIDVPTALTDDISEQLRQRVMTARDMHLVSGKDLVEVKLVFSCADEAATCMAQAGKSLDAQKIIYGSVKKVGDDYAIWLKMFDVRKAKIESWLTETLLKKNADPAAIKVGAGRWFAKLTGRPVSAGTVQVTSSPFGAVVSLDGVPVGATTEQPLTIAEVAAGKHELTLAKPGHNSAKQQFMVAPGQTVPVNLTLLPIGAAGLGPTPATPGSPTSGTSTPQPVPRVATDSEQPGRPEGTSGDVRPGGGYRSAFWVTLVTGLASAGAAVKFGVDVSNINQSLDPYRRFPCTSSTSGYCDGNGKAVGMKDLTPGEKSIVVKKTDEGNRDQTLQWICVGVGSALGIASGFLFYKGYIDSGDEHAAQQAHRGLRIFPTAGGSSSGIVAEFEF